MLDLFLNGMAAYGPWVLGLALLLGAGGLPVPIGLLVLAAGGMARQGLLDWPAAVAASLVGVVLGDIQARHDIHRHIVRGCSAG